MNEKIDPLICDRPVKCEVCGQITYVDEFGNSDKCPNCGWKQCRDNDILEELQGVSYPMLVPVSRAQEQYKAGQKFKATFDDFINGLLFYAEMLFWYKGVNYAVFLGKRLDGKKDDGRNSEACSVDIGNKDFCKTYATVQDFRENAEIDGKRLQDIWDEVVHPCFMYCGDPDKDYDVPPED